MSLPREPEAFAAAAPGPVSDEDTLAVLGRALADLAGRRGLTPTVPTMTIHLLASLIEQADRCLPYQISQATAEDTSWATIAALLGTSSHEARLTYHPDSPMADTRMPWNN